MAIRLLFIPNKLEKNTKSIFEQFNARTYSRAAIKRLYTNEKWLPSEASLILDYGTDLVSKRVLELGAGSGRIASVLKHRTSEYYATDINPDMISTLRDVHPGVKASVADARKLDNFRDSDYDTVIFSFCGIDCLPFRDRPLALSEINRVLKPGGAFIHSTHNVTFARSASHNPKLRNYLNSLIEFCLRKYNRWKLARHEYYSQDYAVVNDRALHNGLLNVYVKPELHFAQLKTAGFVIEAMYDRSGRKIPKDVIPTDQWFYLVARKMGD
jgi:ubiquinone/menaquinone biosynthesis C-methylase UbiE